MPPNAGTLNTYTGVALLEVVVALALFFSMAVAVLGGLSICVQSARQTRLEAQAADLAVTLLSEIQLGVVPVADDGPTAYDDPLADWTWEIVAGPVESTVPGLELSRVEIIIRNTTQGFTHRLYHLAPQLEEELTSTPATAGLGETP